MDGEFPEEFNCPVCFEIPKREIFQCQNGHTICDICVQSLSLCPQCRISLGLVHIRNRALERILDMMKFDCSYKSKGCTTKVPRKEITSHFENCLFGGERVPLCMHLGFTCNHTVNTKKLQESLNHLEQEHNCILTNDKVFEIKAIKLKNFDQNQRCLWMPIIVNAFNTHYLIVICSVGSNISFVCVSLGKEQNDNIQIKFRIASQVDNMPALEWMSRPVSQAHSEAFLKSHPFQFPYCLFLERYLEDEDLTIQVNINDKICNDIPRPISVPELYSCIVPQSVQELCLPDPPKSFSRAKPTSRLTPQRVALLSSSSPQRDLSSSQNNRPASEALLSPLEQSLIELEERIRRLKK